VGLPSSEVFLESERTATKDLRFSGLHPAARAFFRALDREPCPTSWPGEDRVAYVAHILGPLKALVGDLSRNLDDVSSIVRLEPRVGASLAWPRNLAPDSADCPVRTVRAWDRAATPATSPLLFVTFSGPAIELGLDAAGGDPAASVRVRDALLGPEEEPRADAAALLCAGWTVEGAAAGLEELPEDLRPWFAPVPLRVSRRLAWEPWLHEPAFALEVADRFRDLLPLFERMRAPHPAASVANGNPRR
jgi:hypothetical protein